MINFLGDNNFFIYRAAKAAPDYRSNDPSAVLGAFTSIVISEVQIKNMEHLDIKFQTVR